ncbi:MgtC/SapB family protein [Dokdonella soli]|uniref:Protein MgtC n=1 Tax=Dokdonella soli TaxID=529810 RepID=A0ABN1IS70_9GAMM
MSVLTDEMLAIGTRLALSVLVGGLIGLNRDLHHKPAGVRTHALVSLGTALMVIVVIPPGTLDGTHYDALSRVIQGVLTGIGFLGAGVILRDPGTQHVSGLTTAATIWLTALLGVACGAGFYLPVAVALVLGVLVLMFGGGIEGAFHRRFWHGENSDEQQPPGKS